MILVLSRVEVGTSYEQLVHSKINKFPKGFEQWYVHMQDFVAMSKLLLLVEIPWHFSYAWFVAMSKLCLLAKITWSITKTWFLILKYVITNGDEWVGLWKGPWDKAIHVSWNKIDTLLCGAQIDWSSVKRTQKKKNNSNMTKNGLSLSTHISRMTIL